MDLIKSRRTTGGQVRLDVGRLADPEVAQEYADKLAQNLEDLDTSEDPQTLWSSFKSRILETASECIRRSLRRQEEETLRRQLKLPRSAARRDLTARPDCRRSCGAEPNGQCGEIWSQRFRVCVEQSRVT